MLSDSEDDAPTPPAPLPVLPIITPALATPNQPTPFQQLVRGESLASKSEAQRLIHEKEQEKKMEMMMGAMHVKAIPKVEDVVTPKQNSREKVIIDLTLSDEDDDAAPPPPPPPHPTPITPRAIANKPVPPNPVLPIRVLSPDPSNTKETVGAKHEEPAMRELMGAMDIRRDEVGNVGGKEKGKEKVVLYIESDDDSEFDYADRISVDHREGMEKEASPGLSIDGEEIQPQQPTRDQPHYESSDDEAMAGVPFAAPLDESNAKPITPEVDLEMQQIAAVESLAEALRAPSSSLDSLDSTPELRDTSVALTNSDRSTSSLPTRGGDGEEEVTRDEGGVAGNGFYGQHAEAEES